MVYSYPTETPAHLNWHTDGPHLFDNKTQLPPHVLNVMVPLCGTSEDVGPTQYAPATHLVGYDTAVAGPHSGNTVNFCEDGATMLAGSVTLFGDTPAHRPALQTVQLCLFLDWSLIVTRRVETACHHSDAWQITGFYTAEWQTGLTSRGHYCT